MSSTLTHEHGDIAGLPPGGAASRLPKPPGVERIRGTNELNKEFLLETIVYDLLWSAFHVGTFATLLSACARTNVDWTLRPWRHLLHDNNKIMQLALRYGPQIGLADDVAANTSKFYSELAAEKLRLVPLVKASAGYSSAERRQVLAARTAWQHLAGDAKSILLVFEAAAVRHLGDLLVEDLRTLCRFLDEAKAGDAKRVGPTGEISLPVLKQMRAEPRLKLKGPCTVILADRSIAAALKDVSASGLGIICDQPLPDKQSITIVMADGRRLQGRVASRRGDQVGLLLVPRLQRNDPLLHRTDG